MAATDGQTNVVAYPVVIVVVERLNAAHSLIPEPVVLMDQLPYWTNCQNVNQKEVRKIDMMLGTTTREMGLKVSKLHPGSLK